MQYGLRKLFLLTTGVAACAALLAVLLPFGPCTPVPFLLASVPFVCMVRGWRLQAQGEEERGSNYVAIGLLLLLILEPIVLMSLVAMTMHMP